MIKYADKIKESSERLNNVRDELQHLTVPELKEMTNNHAKPFVVCCLNMNGDLNVGMIARTSHLLGTREVIIWGRKKIDARSLVGVDKYTTLTKIYSNEWENGREFGKYMADNKLLPIFTEQGYSNFKYFNWKGYITENINFAGLTPCFIFGNEGEGIPKSFIHACNPPRLCTSIPQKGVLRSYNVSAAAAIVLSHVAMEMSWI